MKRKIIALFLAVLMAALAGCAASGITAPKGTAPNAASGISPTMPSERLRTTVTWEQVMQIQENMTLGEVISILGRPYGSVGNVIHPFFFEWNIEDNDPYDITTLHITFSGEDYETFDQQLRDRAFVLPEETVTFGWSENEKKVIDEWVSATKAVEAYITSRHKDDEILFPVE